MDSNIERLWNGNIKPYETCGTNNPEITELTAYMQRHLANLVQTMDKKQNTIFDNYLACADERLYLIAVHAFEEGFSLATKLITAALKKDN